MAKADYRIGIVGVGRMGANMARRLHDLHYNVVALYDVLAQQATTLAEELGCEAVPTPARVVELANTVLTVVSDDRAMQNIYAPAQPDSLLLHAGNRLFINCATLATPSLSLSTTKRRCARPTG
ncbi:NAD(P)-dependent oxidoreductase, partial [Nitrospirales bacterium NOB]|nr:NAD(P)-dependent oxidoreductase [Nitrospirales bacterium NOB]